MKSIVFYLLLLLTFAVAAFEKIFAGEVPPWFVKQFTGSVFDRFSHSIELAYFVIIILEASTAILILAGLIGKFRRADFGTACLDAGVLLAQLTFLSLSIGQRLTHRYDEALILFALTILVFAGGFVAERLEA